MRTVKNKSERGSAILEFALGFSILWAMFAGVFQFGYSFYVYNTLMTSAANAAQLGSKMTYDTANPSEYTTALKNMVVYGNTTAGSAPIVPHLSTSNVSVTMNLQASMPTDVTISINNFTIDAVFAQFALNGKPRVTTVYMGKITCSTC